MGIVNKGAKCNVDGCDEDGVRSLNTKKVEDAGLRLNSSGKKSALCKQHYKAVSYTHLTLPTKA